MTYTSQRLQRFQPNFFAEMNRKIEQMTAQGGHIIRLDIGSPDLPPASHIIQRLAESAASPDNHGYQSHRAIPALRQAWVAMYQRLYNVQLDPESQVVPLLGSKEGIFHLLLALVDPGDMVLIPDPGYITYTQGTLAAGGQPYYLPLLPENGYLPDLDAIPADIARRARVLWLNYPNSPTGAIATLEYFYRVVEFARHNQLLLVHDAAYSQVTYDGYVAPSLLQVPGSVEVSVELNTLSKSHNMAGWRVGAALGSPSALRALFTVKTHADSGHFLPILEASVAALTGDQSWLRARNEVYRQRCDVVIQALHSMGIPAPSPRAALYVWFPVPGGGGSMEYSTYILENAGVCLAPGIIFGAHGENFMRLSLTSPLDELSEAMQRMKSIS